MSKKVCCHDIFLAFLCNFIFHLQFIQQLSFGIVIEYKRSILMDNMPMLFNIIRAEPGVFRSCVSALYTKHDEVYDCSVETEQGIVHRFISIRVFLSTHVLNVQLRVGSSHFIMILDLPLLSDMGFLYCSFYYHSFTYDITVVHIHFELGDAGELRKSKAFSTRLFLMSSH